MTRPSATCELWVNDTRVPDTGEDLVLAQPTALDGLTLNWGRDSSSEQPSPATCSFVILDRYAQSDFLDRLHVGSPVELWAEGRYRPPATHDFIETVDDPTFGIYPTGPLTRDIFRATAPSGTPARSIDSVSERGNVARTRFTTDATLTMIMPPRPFTKSASEDPDAWDSIPRARNGSTAPWRYRCTFKAPPGSEVRVMAAGFPAPYSNGFQGVEVSSYQATGDWQAVELTVAPVLRSAYPDGLWQGLVVTLFPRSTLFWADQPGVWDDQGPRTWADPVDQPDLYVDDLSIGRPGGSDIVRRVLMFSGSVTDVVAKPEGDGVLRAAITAADLGSTLGNRVIGDTPWPVQTLKARADRIAVLAGITGLVQIDPPIQALQVSYRDVDAQAAYALLQDLAQTGGGVLWAATHATSGPFLRIENPSTRASLRQLAASGGTSTLVATNPATNPSLEAGVITGWLTGATAVTAVSLTTLLPISGTYSALSTRNALGTSNNWVASFAISAQSTRFPITLGQPVTCSVDVKVERAGRRIETYFAWYNVSNAVVSNSAPVIMVPDAVAGTVYRVSATETPTDAGATQGYLYVRVVTTSGADAVVGERVWVDRFRRGGTDYFDGNTPAGGGFTYRWTGTALASSSERWQPGGPITITGSTDNVTMLSACDLLEEPVSWRQDTADVSTVVAVSWLQQGTGSDGLPTTTERAATVTDPAGVITYGTRRLSISTELISATDAQNLASVSLAAARAVPWRIEGLTLDTDAGPDELESVDDPSREVALLNLLDGVIRMGLAVTLVDMPSYAPHGAISDVYVEGGTYTFEDGAWTLALSAVPASAQGGSAQWRQLNTTWTWSQWSPSITWQDLFGVSA